MALIVDARCSPSSLLFFCAAAISSARFRASSAASDACFAAFARWNFATFAAVMQTFGSGRTLVHCEVNFRASVFGFLYRVLYQGADVDEAMSLMQSIWVPNDTWEAFIVRVMSDRGIDYPGL